MGEQDGEDSHFGFLAVMTPEHSSLNVHGIPTSREHRAEDAASGSLRLCHHYRMPNDEPKKSEGKFSEVARKSREKRAEMEQRKRDEDAGVPERGSNGEADVKDR
jgi:hypothetical protein